MTDERTDAAATGPDLSGLVFEVGGRSLLPPSFGAITEIEAPKKSQLFQELVSVVQQRLGTLLKIDNVTFFFGAGSSKGAGGVTLGSVPLAIEKRLVTTGMVGGKLEAWLRLFYLAIKRVGSIPGLATEVDVGNRTNEVTAGSAVPLDSNFENVLALLWQWRAAMRYDDHVAVEGMDSVLSRDVVDQCLNEATRALAKVCELPLDGGDLLAHREFMRKALLRPPNSNRISVFTVNYDTLFEQAADAEGIVLLDGFVGTLRRVFRPESYDREIYAAQPGHTLVPIDRLIRLYKLHGSINWRTDVSPEWVNPHGVSVGPLVGSDDATIPLVYPTPSKLGETLGMPYAELFRRFAATVVREQTTLIVCGYGFGDQHVNEILWQALTIPTFTLVVVQPNPAPADPGGNFVARLRAINDPRVWIIGGQELGTFAKFVTHALPDLRGDDIENLIAKTYLALKSTPMDEVS